MSSLDHMKTKTSIEDDKNREVLIMKIVSLFFLLGITLLFGYLPLIWYKFLIIRKKVKTSTKFMGIANAFSGGIFIGIALFHLLPEVY